jgi:hypothetical protein
MGGRPDQAKGGEAGQRRELHASGSRTAGNRPRGGTAGRGSAYEASRPIAKACRSLEFWGAGRTPPRMPGH